MAPQLPKSPRPIAPEDLVGDTTAATSPLRGTVWVNPERMSGAPCFFATRVPVQTLFDYLRAGHSINDFLTDFPGVLPEQVHTVLDHAFRHALEPRLAA